MILLVRLFTNLTSKIILAARAIEVQKRLASKFSMQMLTLQPPVRAPTSYGAK